MSSPDRARPQVGAGAAPVLTTGQAAALPMLAGAGVLIGTWTLLPRYVGPRLELGPRGNQLEFVDHVIPGILVIALSLLALLIVRRARPGALFVVGLVIILPGLWMTAAHVPLVLQAFRHQAPWPATAHHTLPGLAVLLLGAVWCRLYRAPKPHPAPATPQV